MSESRDENLQSNIVSAVLAENIKNGRSDISQTRIVEDVLKDFDNFSEISKEQQIEKIKEGKIYFSELLGREGNLEAAFREFEKDNQELLKGYEGKDVLIKVNLVDPDNPEGCTNAQSIKKVIELIKKYKPKKIYIGDIPSGMGKRGRNWIELKKIYEDQLGYEFGEEAELIDLDSLPDQDLEIEGEHYQVKDLSKFGGIINLSRPKMHGEFGFTGCTKNLMGFLTQESRSDLIHTGKEVKSGKDYDPQLVHERLRDFSFAMLRERPDIIHISDGYDFTIGHEHFGPEIQTDFATVSLDPINSDNEALNLIGLDKEKIKYLQGEEFKIMQGKLKGQSTRNNLHASPLEQKIFMYKCNPPEGESYVPIIADKEFYEYPKMQEMYINATLNFLKYLIEQEVKAQKIENFDIKNQIQDICQNFDNFKEYQKRIFNSYKEQGLEISNFFCWDINPNEEDFQKIVEKWLEKNYPSSRDTQEEALVDIDAEDIEKEAKKIIDDYIKNFEEDINKRISKLNLGVNEQKNNKEYLETILKIIPKLQQVIPDIEKIGIENIGYPEMEEFYKTLNEEEKEYFKQNYQEFYLRVTREIIKLKEKIKEYLAEQGDAAKAESDIVASFAKTEIKGTVEDINKLKQEIELIREDIKKIEKLIQSNDREEKKEYIINLLGYKPNTIKSKIEIDNFLEKLIKDFEEETRKLEDQIRILSNN